MGSIMTTCAFSYYYINISLLGIRLILAILTGLLMLNSHLIHYFLKRSQFSRSLQPKSLNRSIMRPIFFFILIILSQTFIIGAVHS